MEHFEPFKAAECRWEMPVQAVGYKIYPHHSVAGVDADAVPFAQRRVREPVVIAGPSRPTSRFVERDQCRPISRIARPDGHLGTRVLRPGRCGNLRASVRHRCRQPLAVHCHDRLIVRRPHELRACYQLPVPVPRLRHETDRIPDGDKHMGGR